MSDTLETIKNAIELSGKTRYRIALETGITQGQLSRLISGERGLSIESLERLADYLGLEIIVRKKRQRKDK